MALEKISGFTEVFLAGASIEDLPGVIKSDGADEQSTSETFSDSSDSGISTQEETSSYQIYYDADWQPCNPDNANYLIRIQINPQGALQHGTFSAQRLDAENANDTDSILYSVETDFCPAPEKEADPS